MCFTVALLRAWIICSDEGFTLIDVFLVSEGVLVSVQAFVYVTAEFETAQNQLNQAVVWSRIVESRAKAAIRDTVRMEYPYALTDPGDQPWSGCSLLKSTWCEGDMK